MPRGWKHDKLGLVARSRNGRLKPKPGVYVIRAARRIDRLRGPDPRGQLVIGCTLDIRRRLNEFYRSAGGEYPSHAPGVRFWNTKLCKTFGKSTPGSLIVEWKYKLPTEPSVVKQEERLLRDYELKFGELPPLNSSGGVSTRDFE